MEDRKLKIKKLQVLYLILKFKTQQFPWSTSLTSYFGSAFLQGNSEKRLDYRVNS